MERSAYLARLLGPLLVVVAIAIVMRPAAFIAMVVAMIADPPLLYTVAVLGVLGGTAIVLAHNVWTLDWRLIITLFGWVSIVDSASWILFPGTMPEVWSWILTESMIVTCGALVLLAGLILCYFGYARGRSD